jgi:hypothetical protein
MSFLISISRHSQAQTFPNHPVAIGVNVGGNELLARSANIGWLRGGDYWRNIEPQQNVWSWSNADNFVNTGLTNGQKVLFLLSGSPTWATPGHTNSNGAYPPDITIWDAYVTAVVTHFSGRVAAYEIWNEPDLSGSSTFGVGWDLDINTVPLYSDYAFHAAAIIHATDPAALVVAPVLSGGANSRTATIFDQFQAHTYQGYGAAHWIDVISAHANANDDQEPSQAVLALEQNKLDVLTAHNPACATKPIWVTEFGWKSGAIGEDQQRKRIKDFLIDVSGWYSQILRWNVVNCFIYVLDNCGTSRSIYYCPSQPKLVVTEYLQTLPFPATQPCCQPAESPIVP